MYLVYYVIQRGSFWDPTAGDYVEIVYKPMSILWQIAFLEMAKIVQEIFFFKTCNFSSYYDCEKKM